MTNLGSPRSAMERLPAPRGNRIFGHLPRWMDDSLSLLEDGSTTGSLFRLRLWRSAVVGSTPDWNRFILGDISAFRSRGSLSQLSPYLSAGIVATDAPTHRPRRKLMNPAFHRAAVVPAFRDKLVSATEQRLPAGEFDVNQWCSNLVQTFINIVFFGGDFPPNVLRSFLAPLDRPMPFPLLPRPFRIHRMNRGLVGALGAPHAGSLADHFAQIEDGADELRVAIAAAYDTTAHTMAFALWELAARPDLNDGTHTANLVSETLRLYPAGWIGSRVSAQETQFEGHRIPAGQLILYSPYLTHRNPDVWDEPLSFLPERFDRPLPAWGYIPYSAGERTCLGAALATLMLQTALEAFSGDRLSRVSGDGRPTGGLTLTPDKKLRLRRVPG